MAWRLATFNVNGIRARLPVVLDWLGRRRPDAACLQETKAADQALPREDLEKAGYHVEYLGQKGYNGVAVLTRRRPREVVRGLDDGVEDPQARFLAVNDAGVWVCNTYVPMGRDPGDPAFGYKLRFLERVLAWLRAHHSPARRLAWVGDLNVAPEPVDVFDPGRLEGHTGFHPEERQRLMDAFQWGLVDCFRQQNPDRRQFSFWDYRLPKSFQRDLGWRLDHILATRPLAEACAACWVDSELRGGERPSDHAPVVAEFDL
jgi:exodeoxyribonuclease-3